MWPFKKRIKPEWNVIFRGEGKMTHSNNFQGNKTDLTIEYVCHLYPTVGAELDELKIPY